MTILVFGHSGQVATELRRDPRVRALPRAEADLSDPAACARAVAESDARAVINAAAWTAVDDAEDHEAEALTVNALAPASMAAAAARAGIPFVHISTDYVFDGSGKRPWRPEDAVAPLGAYGRTKQAGEAAVAAVGGAHAILRTSWVFSAHGRNFLRTMLRLGADRDRLTVVADQIGGPTPADAIADACLTIADALIHDPARSGIYHFSGAPDVSWAGFAREIMARAGLACAIEDIPTSAYPTRARRPANSRLDCSTLATAFGIARPDWRAGIDRALAALREQPA
ncbi:MAG: dTDP-4-dehydrorhamnose reductase [Gemmobacter sp.]